MKPKDAGVRQLENGNWEYRFIVKVNGKNVVRRKRKDEDGNPFKTQAAAVRARELAIQRETEAAQEAHPVSVPRKTVAEVYQEYCEKGRSGKAYNTVKKQDSLWNNHLCAKFGGRFVDEISVAEIMDYLTDLYYKEGRAYRYVESFLKMFYLIFGQAYSRNYLDIDTYSKLCLNKGTKITMPKMKVTEDDDIVVFSMEEMGRMDEYFSGSNAETAYLLGKYCGLRINECYGLKWENVDLDNGTIRIDRQMQHQNGLIKLVPVKTRNGNRTIFLCQKLKVHFQKLERERASYEKEMREVRQQKQSFIEDIDGNMISSLDLVNSLPNGKIQTVNSMKYHSRTIKTALGISFKYHYLRHTFGTMMAEKNTPQHLLCNQMGHASVRVTQKYYIALSKTGIEILMGNLNAL